MNGCTKISPLFIKMIFLSAILFIHGTTYEHKKKIILVMSKKIVYVMSKRIDFLMIKLNVFLMSKKRLLGQCLSFFSYKQE